MTTVPVSHAPTAPTTVKPTEVFDHIATLAKCGGFSVIEQVDGAWQCLPWSGTDALGYGSTVFLAIADAARQLEHQEAHP